MRGNQNLLPSFKKCGGEGGRGRLNCVSLQTSCLISAIIKKAFSVVSSALELDFHLLGLLYIHYIFFCKPIQHANKSTIIKILFRAASVHIIIKYTFTKRLEFHHYHPFLKRSFPKNFFVTRRFWSFRRW